MIQRMIQYYKIPLRFRRYLFVQKKFLLVLRVVNLGLWVDGRRERVEEGAVVHQHVVDAHLERVVRTDNQSEKEEST